MVRLFVPEGEDQHVVTSSYRDGFPTEPSLFASATRSCVIAAVMTAAGALGGAAAPGLFVKCVAIVGLVDLPHTALLVYGRRELDSAVLKVDNITPKPGKLWERTSFFTVDDAYLSGGALGALAALNPRALPGVRGWKRFFGAATIGSAIGAQIGYKVMEADVGRDAITRGQKFHWSRRCAQYQEKLASNEKARASLFWPGRTVLALNALASSRLGQFTERFGYSAFRRQLGSPPGPGHAHNAGEWHTVPPRLATQQSSQETIAFTIQLDKSVSNGHDVLKNFRVYRDSLPEKDAEEIQERLSHLHELKDKMNSETKFLWQVLAKKEGQLYDMVEEDYEKDILRRQLQLLNSMTMALVQRESIITYHIADARKQLRQIDRNDTNSHADPVIAEALGSEVFIERETVHSPDIIVKDVRLHWANTKDKFAVLQTALQHHRSNHPKGSDSADTIKQIDEVIDNSKRNIEATERLLKEFEAQVLKAEATAAKQGEPKAAEQK
ncbi:hypothetical protein IQ07DRAFT_649481 [Pyrenochaeta sp. DS3sAY3a]|nr:hypothetical protein IQ07DRAFT_649481 [Pyrenochaeta sp. DS3sAY3a]